jgi:dTDP-4-dehydrorhamnose reductase
MSILILGGRGNLGTQLAKSLAADYEVVAWDREDLDFSDFKTLIGKVRELAPGIIINAAAYNAVDKCEDKTEYETAVRLNADLPGLLADLALEQDALLIHYSSDYVFSGTELKSVFTEEDTPNPVNKYGESKFRGEREVFRRAGSGLKYYLIRTSKLFGPRGASPGAKPSFFDIMLDLAQNKKELTVVNEELSCFTYTPDLATATRRLWELERPYGLYHLVNEGPVTWYDAARELFRLKKMSVPIRSVRSENLLRAARRPKFSVLQNTKVKKLRSWGEALQEYLRS